MVFKLPFGCLETVCGKALWAGSYWGASSLNVVGDVVLDWGVRSRDLGEGRELRRQVEVGVGVVLGADGRAGGDI